MTVNLNTTLAYVSAPGFCRGRLCDEITEKGIIDMIYSINLLE